MGVEVIVPLGLFAAVAAMVLVPAWLKSRDRRDMQQTVRHALDKGEALPAELVEAIAKASRGRIATAHTDLRTGVIWLAVAAGVATFGWMIGFEDQEAVYPMVGLAAVPGFLGLAFVILSFFNKTRAD
ncbi:DUF6249 domain-containing protein [Brevundimonas aveniformis]|mgnify:CR=1 FL=1|uniref:DUF6249 domain-containing protein n=1 Tax=Brevundimonas aveniformis TaxID=370977 RepID=UPI002490160B|nr:DUF6249 domain-containing protein [Brevundimonas aveniformis]